MSKSLYEEEEDSNGWIMIFADLMTLLLVFFILLFTMSSTEQKKFEQAVQSIQSSLMGGPIPSMHPVGTRIVPNMELSPELGQNSVENPATKDVAIEAEPQPSPQIQTQPSIGDQGDNWEELANTLRSQMHNTDPRSPVQVTTPKDGTISIQISGSVMFDSGSVYLNSTADPMLDNLKQLFDQYGGYKINIEGHTDNIPIRSSQFDTNWELSAVRATTVLRYFVQEGIHPHRFTATGYGDSMPIADNDSVEGREENRRIEIVLEKQPDGLVY